MPYQSLAAVDIGSNTVHLLVAATDGQRIVTLADESIFIRLADGVWNLGYIPDERILATTQALLHLRDVARGFGAERIVVVATEVARSAKNTAALQRAVQATTGLEPLVLSGMDEAMLTFHGVTAGRHLPSGVAVADLGGGSLEIIIAELGLSPWRRSLPLGSSFMHDRFIDGDPPEPVAVEALRRYLVEKLAEIPKMAHADEILVTGGTVNALLRLVQQAQGRAVGDRILRRTDLDHALSIMLEQPAALVAADYRLRLERARLLPAGTIILSTLLDHLHLPGILVSAAGIREGIVLSTARHGANWLEGAREEGYQSHARAGTFPHGDEVVHVAAPRTDLPAIATQPATLVAWQKIADIIESLARYRKDALDGDADAVHDMRVGARRLRTTIETFAPCFPAIPTRRLLRAVKQLARVLGEVRDADVALEALRSRLSDADPELHPGLRLLIEQRVKERSTARRAMRRHLSAEWLTVLRDSVKDLRLDPAKISAIREGRVAPPAAPMASSEEVAE